MEEEELQYDYIAEWEALQERLIEEHSH